jgi:IS5 family transposase
MKDYRIEKFKENEVNFNLALKWFVGLAIDEPSPDSSSLTRFRDRLGEERFAPIFNQIVELAREKPFFGYKAHASMDSDSELITKLGPPQAMSMNSSRW